MVIESKRIVLGVTGSIAAYKAVELLRLLQKRKAEVRVVMTSAATKFISPLTFESLTGYPVHCSTIPDSGVEIVHTTLASWGDLFVVAPATANTIAKIAAGIADTPVTEIALCFQKGIICPAMNVRMFENPITQENVIKLKEKGWEIVEPTSGFLACREEGKGRLAEIEDIVDAVNYWFIPKLLKGRKVVVTAGATREYIDPVRFISNPSSGKMGFAIARVAKGAGAEVTLITGKTHLRTPYGVKRVDVETVEEMKNAVLREIDNADIFISSAAVGDFKPETVSNEKIKKNGNSFLLNLIRTPDILKSVEKKGLIKVGFAAETENLIENALKKLKNKNLHMVVANNVKEGIFSSDTTEATIITKDGKTIQFSGSKEKLAFKIVEKVSELI